MTSSKNKIWGEKWVQGEHIAKGGQGLTYQVTDITTGKSGFALKVLKEQKNPNKRSRMYKEVAAYKILNNTGIPKLIDTNVDLYEGDTPLFIVTDFIEGPTLEKFIETNGILSLDKAILLVKGLLSIVSYCHGLEIIHRDIKPDNIILENGDIEKPFLIDFGLCFNKNNDERATPSSEQLTNRFLHLPELSIQLAKMDTRTDVTYCAGIFFYILTGERPQDLVDHSNSKPHQKDFMISVLIKLEKDQRQKIQLIFDRAFELHIDSRYQSIEAFQKDLEQLLVLSDKRIEPEIKLINLKKNKNNYLLYIKALS